MKLIALMGFCLITLWTRAQAERVRSLGGEFSYQSQDFFIGFHVASQKKRFEHKLQLQTAVRSTFFQGRVFPQLSYQFTYYPLNAQKWRAGLCLRPVFSALNSKKDSQNGYVFYEELLPGITINYGQKHRIGLSAFYGGNLEHRYSDLNNAYHTYFSWKFNTEIIYSYAL